MNKKNNKILFMSFSQPITESHLYKELGEIPYYISKIYGYDSYIDDYYDPYNRHSSFFRQVHLLRYPSQSKINYLKKIFRILLNAKKIDLLYLLQITPDSLLKMLAYRIGGGTGKIYLKLDLGLYEKNGKDLLVWNNMNFFLRSFHMLFKNLPSIYTVETKDSYNRLLGSYYQSLVNQKKLYLMPNGFDSEILSELNIVKLPVSEKQNIILTVGRIGTYQKNTELLLDILSRVNLKGWKVYIVGAIDKIFINNIESFYSQFPDKKDSVIFTGEISQRELYNYYNISRVFLLTSRHESYAFVLAEAAYMNNYIISTNVGIAPELLDYAAGHIVENNLSESFVNEIQRIINLSSQDLNQLIPYNGKQNIDMITWDWILKNNAGILKLIDKS